MVVPNTKVDKSDAVFGVLRSTSLGFSNPGTAHTDSALHIVFDTNVAIVPQDRVFVGLPGFSGAASSSELRIAKAVTGSGAAAMTFDCRTQAGCPWHIQPTHHTDTSTLEIEATKPLELPKGKATQLRVELTIERLRLPGFISYNTSELTVGIKRGCGANQQVSGAGCVELVRAAKFGQIEAVA